ncbi:hypothetical protein KUTeg_001768 [Tegillarca granosa]|uniref:Uncharacterized protein n=1 Tax=Tegillarca granosa TaxID=220873 RepID=A0ABQ9FSE5_TEGGR|nr:hypothetical protein KUTeg_001768 [Tegillarca granosa]
MIFIDYGSIGWLVKFEDLNSSRTVWYKQIKVNDLQFQSPKSTQWIDKKRKILFLCIWIYKIHIARICLLGFYLKVANKGYGCLVEFTGWLGGWVEYRSVVWLVEFTGWLGGWVEYRRVVWLVEFTGWLGGWVEYRRVVWLVELTGWLGGWVEYRRVVWLIEFTGWLGGWVEYRRVVWLIEFTGWLGGRVEYRRVVWLVEFTGWLGGWVEYRRVVWLVELTGWLGGWVEYRRVVQQEYVLQQEYLCIFTIGGTTRISLYLYYRWYNKNIFVLQQEYLCIFTIGVTTRISLHLHYRCYNKNIFVLQQEYLCIFTIGVTTRISLYLYYRCYKKNIFVLQQEYLCIFTIGVTTRISLHLHYRIVNLEIKWAGVPEYCDFDLKGYFLILKIKIGASRNTKSEFINLSDNVKRIRIDHTITHLKPPPKTDEFYSPTSSTVRIWSRLSCVYLNWEVKRTPKSSFWFIWLFHVNILRTPELTTINRTSYLPLAIN